MNYLKKKKKKQVKIHKLKSDYSWNVQLSAFPASRMTIMNYYSFSFTRIPFVTNFYSSSSIVSESLVGRRWEAKIKLRGLVPA